MEQVQQTQQPQDDKPAQADKPNQSVPEVSATKSLSTSASPLQDDLFDVLNNKISKPNYSKASVLLMNADANNVSLEDVKKTLTEYLQKSNVKQIAFCTYTPSTPPNESKSENKFNSYVDVLRYHKDDKNHRVKVIFNFEQSNVLDIVDALLYSNLDNSTIFLCLSQGELSYIDMSKLQEVIKQKIKNKSVGNELYGYVDFMVGIQNNVKIIHEIYKKTFVNKDYSPPNMKDMMKRYVEIVKYIPDKLEKSYFVYNKDIEYVSVGVKKNNLYSLKSFSSWNVEDILNLLKKLNYLISYSQFQNILKSKHKSLYFYGFCELLVADDIKLIKEYISKNSERLCDSIKSKFVQLCDPKLEKMGSPNLFLDIFKDEIAGNNSLDEKKIDAFFTGINNNAFIRKDLFTGYAKKCKENKEKPILKLVRANTLNFLNALDKFAYTEGKDSIFENFSYIYFPHYLANDNKIDFFANEKDILALIENMKQELMMKIPEDSKDNNFNIEIYKKTIVGTFRSDYSHFRTEDKLFRKLGDYEKISKNEYYIFFDFLKRLVDSSCNSEFVYINSRKPLSQNITNELVLAQRPLQHLMINLWTMYLVNFKSKAFQGYIQHLHQKLVESVKDVQYLIAFGEDRENVSKDIKSPEALSYALQVEREAKQDQKIAEKNYDQIVLEIGKIEKELESKINEYKKKINKNNEILDKNFIGIKDNYYQLEDIKNKNSEKNDIVFNELHGVYENLFNYLKTSRKDANGQETKDIDSKDSRVFIKAFHNIENFFSQDNRVALSNLNQARKYRDVLYQHFEENEIFIKNKEQLESIKDKLKEKLNTIPKQAEKRQNSAKGKELKHKAAITESAYNNEIDSLIREASYGLHRASTKKQIASDIADFKDVEAFDHNKTVQDIKEELFVTIYRNAFGNQPNLQKDGSSLQKTTDNSLISKILSTWDKTKKIILPGGKGWKSVLSLFTLRISELLEFIVDKIDNNTVVSSSLSSPAKYFLSKILPMYIKVYGDENDASASNLEFNAKYQPIVNYFVRFTNKVIFYCNTTKKDADKLLKKILDDFIKQFEQYSDELQVLYLVNNIVKYHKAKENESEKQQILTDFESKKTDPPSPQDFQTYFNKVGALFELEAYKESLSFLKVGEQPQQEGNENNLKMYKKYNEVFQNFIKTMYGEQSLPDDFFVYKMAYTNSLMMFLYMNGNKVKSIYDFKDVSINDKLLLNIDSRAHVDLFEIVNKNSKLLHDRFYNTDPSWWKNMFKYTSHAVVNFQDYIIPSYYFVTTGLIEKKINVEKDTKANEEVNTTITTVHKSVFEYMQKSLINSLDKTIVEINDNICDNVIDILMDTIAKDLNLGIDIEKIELKGAKVAYESENASVKIICMFANMPPTSAGLKEVIESCKNIAELIYVYKNSFETNTDGFIKKYNNKKLEEKAGNNYLAYKLIFDDSCELNEESITKNFVKGVGNTIGNWFSKDKKLTMDSISSKIDEEFKKLMTNKKLIDFIRENVKSIIGLYNSKDSNVKPIALFYAKLKSNSEIDDNMISNLKKSFDISGDTEAWIKEFINIKNNKIIFNDINVTKKVNLKSFVHGVANIDAFSKYMDTYMKTKLDLLEVQEEKVEENEDEDEDLSPVGAVTPSVAAVGGAKDDPKKVKSPIYPIKQVIKSANFKSIVDQNADLQKLMGSDNNIDKKLQTLSDIKYEEVFKNVAKGTDVDKKQKDKDKEIPLHDLWVHIKSEEVAKKQEESRQNEAKIQNEEKKAMETAERKEKEAEMKQKMDQAAEERKVIKQGNMVQGNMVQGNMMQGNMVQGNMVQGNNMSLGNNMAQGTSGSSSGMGSSSQGNNKKILKSLKRLAEFRKQLDDFKEFHEELIKNQDHYRELFDNKLIKTQASIAEISVQVNDLHNTRLSVSRKAYVNTYNVLFDLYEEKFNTNFDITKNFFVVKKKSVLHELNNMKDFIERKNNMAGGNAQLNALINDAAKNEILKGVAESIQKENKNTTETLVTKIEEMNRSLKEAILKQQSQALASATSTSSSQTPSSAQPPDPKFQELLLKNEQLMSRFEKTLSTLESKTSNNDVILEKTKELVDEFQIVINGISLTNTNFMKDVMERVSTMDKLLLLYDTNLKKPQLTRIEDAQKDFKEDLKAKDDKLICFYSLKYSIMDLMDSQFYMMYFIKVLRILFAYVSLFLATRIFSPIYENAVYDQQKNPPPLALFTGIYLALDLAFNAFLYVLLYLIKVLFTPEDGAFVIDKYLFKKYVTDYILSTAFLLWTSNMVGLVIMKKKYFKYKYEGLRAIRAFEDMMFSMCIMIYLFPFFWLL